MPATLYFHSRKRLFLQHIDTQGPVRKLYQGVSKASGKGDVEANIAYGAVDVGTSIYGLGRLLLKRDAWRLFRYIRADYVRVYSQTSVPALTFEAISNGITLKSMRDEFEKHDR